MAHHAGDGRRSRRSGATRTTRASTSTGSCSSPSSASAAVGLLAIYSARYQSQTLNGLDPYFFVKRQGVALAVGLVGMAVVLAVDYRRWRDLAPWFYAATTISLVALLLVGQSRKGAVAWFEVGGFQLQPSEFAKITLILILAAYLGSGERADGLPFNRFVVALIIAAVPMGLTLAQPDLGTASVMVAILMGDPPGGRRPDQAHRGDLGDGADHDRCARGHRAARQVPAGPAAQLPPQQLQHHRREPGHRARAAPAESARQVENSETAISRGGLTGEGFLEGTMTNGGYVPEQHTDFVFTAVGEQFGLLGTMVVLLLFGLLGFRICRTAQLAGDLIGHAASPPACSSLLAWHVFENIGMTMGIMPVTGIPAAAAVVRRVVAPWRSCWPSAWCRTSTCAASSRPRLGAARAARARPMRSGRIPRPAGTSVPETAGARPIVHEAHTGRLARDMTLWPRLEPLLAKVQKPARYIGCEDGALTPEHGPGKVAWLLVYPDAYEIGLPNQGLQILYEILNERDDAVAERSLRAVGRPRGPAARAPACRCSRSTPTARPTSST